MSDVGTIMIESGIGVLTIDNPPVNALGFKTRKAIFDGFKTLEADDRVQAIVLICGGRTFFAGADISEFGMPFQQPDLRVVLAALERSSKPLIAAIHGTALGGGYETALVCHYRIAVPSAKVGLPEVHLGLLPGAGGTQRLPRVVGVEAALDIMTTGRPVPAKKAKELGMIDALAEEGKLREDAIAFARQILESAAPLVRVRDREDKIAPARGTPEIYAAFLEKNKRAFRGFKAPANIVAAVQAAAETADFDAGLVREVELFDELMASSESAAQRYYFFAERETTKIPTVPSATPKVDIIQVGVIGAGTMGGGIAMNFLNIGMPVTLVETSQAALDRGISVIRRNYEITAQKGRMTQGQVEQRMALITPALGLEALAEVDLVIEAVFEEMDVKKDVFGKLDKICKQGALLASNTSFLDVDEIASVTSRPQNVLGLHFFSPANVMRLLEVVRGEKTSKEAIATAMALGKRLGKVPVLSGVCFGFIANRIMTPYTAGAMNVLLEGGTPEDVDAALVSYGFAMGPLAMLDLVGLDVIGRESSERTIPSELVKLGRLGQKQNGGFYDYDEKRCATPSPVAAKIVADLSRDLGVENKGTRSAEQIVAQLLYPVVNEGAKVLEEGIALRASDIDVAAILGYNWPIYTGGPMFWADTVGLSKIVEGLRAAGIEPAALLVRKAEAGEALAR
ncbi:3-hydroxyacyl-CoA dehydrogenase NAD-binding domain-containing protein [Novosphingobium colocasiae]|uniref:3-hydroxyacyl-CoA dehydrogenase n=1 Tax=Novosphingobium colocasiae TaxID=1256513 RepID=A0A918PPA1_9SPHN|nr:3-hydroxyacyl-CoA dehydrogenase NAD-binding domain-containing protein [Novosphingobium colocasiae]GGZ17321.1 3-hydroxyacyl-CoA dehydrogenase [Novosphingobium colocasiae]